MKYQVGELANFEEGDPEFDTEGECIEWIKVHDNPYGFFGILTGQNFGSELICIVYEGEVFRK